MGVALYMTYKLPLVIAIGAMTIFSAIDISSWAAILSLLIVGSGIGFTGYFGFRDKAWKTAAGGWKDAFEQQLAENKALNAQLALVLKELETLKAQPDMTAVLAALRDHSDTVKDRHMQILQALSGLSQGQGRIERGQ